MKNIILITAAVLFCIVFTKSILLDKSLNAKAQDISNIVVATTSPIESKVYVPTHAQKVWLHALEWCESSGRKSSINPKDKDGTASYYSFQFKPSTFKALAIKYEILKPSDVNTSEKLMSQLKDYDNQYNIVASMINDKSTRWRSQFPGCVAKIGLPPRY